MASNPYANLVKMLNAITLLSQPAGTTIKALMERLEVSRRTVFRLLEALEGLGFPLVSEKSEFNGKKTYRLLDTFVQRLPNISLPGFSFTPQEALYLQLLLDRPGAFPDPDINAALASLRKKIDPIIQQNPNPDSTNSKPIAAEGEGRLLSSIRSAILGHKACAIRYRSFEPPGSRLYVIHPLRLVEDSGAYFLFASLPQHGAIRLLPLDRIASLEVLDNTFQSNQDEAVDAILAKSFDLDSPILTKVVIRFSAKLAGLIKNKQFSLLQCRADAADGSCTLTIVTSSPNDLVRYVLSCGPDAEILAPPDLRAQAEQELSASLAKYTTSSRG